MAFSRHENIKILEKTLQWCKNGILRFGADISESAIRSAGARTLQPVPVRASR